MSDGSDTCSVLTIDLGALRRNWRTIAQKVTPARCAGVIKANAYGTGLAPAARALRDEGCRIFFVARISEGVLARTILPDAIIYVLDGLMPGTAPFLRAHDLRPVLGSLEEITEWRHAGGGAAALHFDAGMNRLGLCTSDAQAALTALGSEPDLIISHFSSAEDVLAPANAREIETFVNLRKMIPNVPASHCNSSGIYLHPQAWHELVRPGYALYGGNPVPGAPNPMAPVIALHAPILQTRLLERGERVGYNGQWTAQKQTRLAIVALGYADGIPRAAMGTDSKAGPDVAINGQRCAIAGRISMDMTAIDISAIPAASARRGAMVEVIGPTISLDEFGERAGTIGYEILTSLGARYRRIYID